MNLEPAAVVLVDDTPYELHPVAGGEECAEIADPQLPRGIGIGPDEVHISSRQIHPAPSRRENGSVVVARAARRDTGDAGNRGRMYFGVVAVCRAPIFRNGRIDLAEREQRFRQAATRAMRIRTQRNGSSQRRGGLAIRAPSDAGTTE